MSRRDITLLTVADRRRASDLLHKAPDGSHMTLKDSKRTNPQNDRMWAMLDDVASQLTWHGIALSSEDWKLMFMDALQREMRIVPNLDGTGFVNLGRSSSRLSKSEMSDLMEVIAAFGASHGVIFHDHEQEAAA